MCRVTSLKQRLEENTYLYFCNNRDDDRPSGGIVRLSEYYYFISNSGKNIIKDSIFDFVPTTYYSCVDASNYVVSSDDVKEILSNLGKHLFTKDIKGFNYVVRRSKELIKNDFSSSKYRRNYIYEGIHPNYHSHEIIFNEPFIEEKDYKIGVELEVECKNEYCYDEVKTIKSNWFRMEKNQSMNSYDVKFVTIPLNPKDAKKKSFWKRLINYLSDKVILGDSSRCSLHCYIGREILGYSKEEQELTLTKLFYLYHNLISESLRQVVFERINDYHVESNESIFDDGLLENSILKNNNIEVCQDYNIKQNDLKNSYLYINISNIAKIVFYKSKVCLNPSRICSIVDYWELMCLYCKETEIIKLTEKGFLDFVNKNTGKNSPLRDKMQIYF